MRFINYCVEKMKCKLLMSRVSYSNIRKLIPNNYSEKKKFEQNPIRNNTSSIEVLLMLIKYYAPNFKKVSEKR